MSSPAPFKVLSLIPPMTQLNTPYPSTAYLTGFLRSRGVQATQEDLALALVLKLFTPAGLEAIRGEALALPEAKRSASVHAFLDQFDQYRSTIGPLLAFLQGRDPTLAHRIASISAYVACTAGEDATAANHAAAFLICDCCGATAEVSPPVADDLGRAAEAAGYAIERTTIEAHGRCPACQ